MPAEERTVLPLAVSVAPSACRQGTPAAAEVVADDDGAEIIDLVDDKPGERHSVCCLNMPHCRVQEDSDGPSVLPTYLRCHQ